MLTEKGGTRASCQESHEEANNQEGDQEDGRQEAGEEARREEDDAKARREEAREEARRQEDGQEAHSQEGHEEARNEEARNEEDGEEARREEDGEEAHSQEGHKEEGCEEALSRSTNEFGGPGSNDPGSFTLLTGRLARVDLASVAMASIRNADENARRLRRGRGLRRSNEPVDTKLRATTEMILAMPVDDRLRQLEAESSFFSSIRPLDG